MLDIHRFFVPCALGLGELLREELEALGGRGVKVEPGGCRVRGPLSFGYRLCLWSRLASRVLWVLRDAVIEGPDDLYAAVRELPWADHVSPRGTLAVDFAGTGAGIDNSQFGAQKVKDAIVDSLREQTGERPSVERRRPDVRVHVHLRGRGCSISLDLSGESLHRRGYRQDAGVAPLKETLAAALLHHGAWPTLAARGGACFDPLCGSGTIVLEAASILLDRAPGLGRTYWGFTGWLGHDVASWNALVAEAEERGRIGPEPVVRCVGFDRDRAVVEAARANAVRAGVQAVVRFDARPISESRFPRGTDCGLLATNPPYGVRLSDARGARETLAELGRLLGKRPPGWSASILATDVESLHVVGQPFSSTLEVRNGPLEAVIGRFDAGAVPVADHPFANRLRKNAKRLKRWREKAGVTCYRLYDADMPEYNVAVDVYGDRVHVQEYAAPNTVDPVAARRRLSEVTSMVGAVLEIPTVRVHLKTRVRQRGRSQYERQGEEGDFFEVDEGGHRFWVNLTDYLDTGLFLDHRDTRAKLAQWASGKRFLNLFCYTGAATVYAAAAGARTTTSVDLSNTYLEWARRNLELNGLRGRAHRLERADCLEWLRTERNVYDVVFLDPPTFSNSKSMSTSWDVARDHAGLIDLAMARLASGGTLVFSTNARRFGLDEGLTRRYDVEPVTWIPRDFEGHTPHRCWTFRTYAAV